MGGGGTKNPERITNVCMSGGLEEQRGAGGTGKVLEKVAETVRS